MGRNRTSPVRKLHINEQVWTWQFVDGVRIVSPSGILYRCALTEEMHSHLFWDEWGEFYHPLPGKVKSYIVNRLLHWENFLVKHRIGFPVLRRAKTMHRARPCQTR